MRLSLAIIFIFSFQNSISQIFKLDQSWFEQESFLLDSVIKNHRINEIRIIVFNKKDGEEIDNANQKMIYQFDENGNQTKGLTINIFDRKQDSSLLEMTYKNGLIQSKTESYSFFKFQYVYGYGQNGLIGSEVKIDLKNHPHDTLFKREYNYDFNTKGYVRSTLNSANKAFILFSSELENNVLNQKTSYMRNSNYTETRFFFSSGILSTKEQIIKFGKQKVERIEYRYKDDKLDESNHYQNGALVKKRGVIYNKEGLLKNVVERNYGEKSVRIYKIEYTFRN